MFYLEIYNKNLYDNTLYSHVYILYVKILCLLLKTRINF